MRNTLQIRWGSHTGKAGDEMAMPSIRKYVVN